MVANPHLRLLLEAFDKKLLPWAKAGSLRLVDMRWPFQFPAGIEVRPLNVPVLSHADSNHFALSDRKWPEHGLHSSPYISLGCILEGEADFCIGVTDKMEGRSHDEKPEAGIEIFSLPAQSFFMISPGVPYPDGTRPHWERPEPKNARSHILWLVVLPRSICVHTCRTEGLVHTHTSAVLINNPQISSQVHFFLDNYQSRLPFGNDIGVASLMTLLLCIRQALEGRQKWTAGGFSEEANAELDAEDPEAAAITINSGKGEFALRQACDYIRSHLCDKLTLTEIARNSHISVSKLKWLFRTEMNISVAKYVVQCRMEEAKTHLLQSESVIEEVGENCGYWNRTHFSKAFKQYHGISPREYRQRHKREARKLAAAQPQPNSAAGPASQK